eukprot:381597-Pelagomonas_calceolata.AAC.4
MALATSRAQTATMGTGHSGLQHCSSDSRASPGRRLLCHQPNPCCVSTFLPSCEAPLLTCKFVKAVWVEQLEWLQADIGVDSFQNLCIYAVLKRFVFFKPQADTICIASPHGKSH